MHIFIELRVLVLLFKLFTASDQAYLVATRTLETTQLQPQTSGKKQWSTLGFAVVLKLTVSCHTRNHDFQSVPILIFWESVYV